MKKRFLGLDCSTKTGAVVLDEDGNVLTSKLLDFRQERGFYRLQLIAKSVRSIVLDYEPTVALIEGYAFGNHNTLVPLVEIGTIVRLELWGSKVPWQEVSPTSLKKWTTGKGNAKKPDMAIAVKNRWDFTSSSDDVIDAYALAQYGRLGG